MYNNPISKQVGGHLVVRPTLSNDILLSSKQTITITQYAPNRRTTFCICLIITAIFTATTIGRFPKLLLFKNTPKLRILGLSIASRPICPKLLNTTRNWPTFQANIDKKYTPACFCPADNVKKSVVYNRWPHGFGNVPTGLKEKIDLIRNVGVLKLKLKNETLESKEQGHLDAYYNSNCRRVNSLESTRKLKCDEECMRFRQLLSSWPCNKPRAFIYILTRWERIKDLKNFLNRLDQYFNNQFHYPLVLFLEKGDKSSFSDLRSFTNSSVFFQTLAFEAPSHIRINETQRISHIGYSHMCQFHSRGLYKQPILDGVDYAWRLDDDSKILAPIRYDLFEFMKLRNLSYGYAILATDSAFVIKYLWETTCSYDRVHDQETEMLSITSKFCEIDDFFIPEDDCLAQLDPLLKYVDEEYIRPTFFSEWHSPKIFYNNFEISDLSIWRSCFYKNYIDYIDRLGGIYYYRWGDAPIKSIAVSLMVPKSKVHKFKGISYRHQNRAV